MSMLTAEQIQEIADKAAFEAWKHLGGETGISVFHHASSFKTDAPARQAFARTVIDLALSKMAESEGDLFTYEEWKKWLTDGMLPTVDTLNQRVRQAMAALRAQMQGEIDALADWKAQAMRVESEWDEQRIAKLLGGQLGESCRKVIEREVPLLLADRDQWKERAEKAEAEVQEKAQARYESLLAKKLEWLEKCIAGDVEAFAKMPHAELIDALKSVRLQLPAACHAVINASVDRLSQLAKQQAPADREAFEKWHRRWEMHSSLATDAFGFYNDGLTERFWKCWQRAALAHKPQPVKLNEPERVEAMLTQMMDAQNERLREERENEAANNMELGPPNVVMGGNYPAGMLEVVPVSPEFELAQYKELEKQLPDGWTFAEMMQENKDLREKLTQHKPQPWIACSERMPTREDGDGYGYVIWWNPQLGAHGAPWTHSGLTPCTHWMPIPPLPTAPTAEKVHGGRRLQAQRQTMQEDQTAMSMSDDLQRALTRIKDVLPDLTKEELAKIERILYDLWLKGQSYDYRLDRD